MFNRSRLGVGICLLLIVPALLTACGGGSSYSSGGSAPKPPAANANQPTASGGLALVKVASLGMLGQGLIDTNGMTLYIRKSDTGGKSSCTGSCATTWPPLRASSNNLAKPQGLSGDLGTTMRDDGSMQVTYNGQPLYTYSGDKAPGDATGQGIGGVWFVASVQGGGSASPSASPTSSSGYNYNY